VPVSPRSCGQQWLVPLLLVVALSAPVLAQSPDEAFLTTLRTLPEAGFADKETIAGTLLASGHPGASAVLTVCKR